MGGIEWLEFALTILVAVMAVAWLWARRYERREREAARLRHEQRLAAWRHVELPEPPEKLPEQGVTRLDSGLVSRLKTDEFEELRHFFGAYFHQDWSLDEDDEDGVIRLYVEEHAHLPNDVVELLHELDRLLAFGLSDRDLADALEALGSDYIPLDATTLWLRSMRGKVLKEAKGG